MVRLHGESPSVGAYSALAQLVEQLTVNQRVAGSSPAGGANFSPYSMGREIPFASLRLARNLVPLENQVSRHQLLDLPLLFKAARDSPG